LNTTNTNLGNLSSTVTNNAGLAAAATLQVATDLGNLSSTVSNGLSTLTTDLNTTNTNLGNLSNTVTNNAGIAAAATLQVATDLGNLSSTVSNGLSTLTTDLNTTNTNLGNLSNTLSTDYVTLATNQTINGTKTFSAPINGDLSGIATTATSLSAQYIDWNAISGPTSIANKPTILTLGGVTSNGIVTGSGFEYTKIVYDAQGLITAGSQATTADIAPSFDKNYITNDQLTVLGNTSNKNTGDQEIHLQGDVTGTGFDIIDVTLANTAVSSGDYTNASISVDPKGRIIAASNGSPGFQNPMQSLGDIIYGNISGTATRLASIGSPAGVLHGGNGVPPSWKSADLTTDVTGILPVGKGGTGLNTTPTNGQILIGNGTGYSLATLTAGTGVTITNISGTLTISAPSAYTPVSWSNTGLISATTQTAISNVSITGGITVTTAGVWTIEAAGGGGGGGGGAGGSSSYFGGGAGGGGEFQGIKISVNVNDYISWTIGQRGTGGSGGTNTGMQPGKNGGTTIVYKNGIAILSAAGGNGGAAGTISLAPNGGTGGGLTAGYNTTLDVKGTNGGNGTSSSSNPGRGGLAGGVPNNATSSDGGDGGNRNSGGTGGTGKDGIAGSITIYHY
jgi:hypothetical protein